MCIIEMEPCDVWSETQRTARKAHRCSSCRGPIGPGERYTVHFSIYDREMTRAKLCGLCLADRMEFTESHGGDLLIPDPASFPTLLRECIGEDEESARRWTPMLTVLEARAPDAASDNWVLMNLDDGALHHNCLGDDNQWRRLLRRGHVKRTILRVSFYRITKAGLATYRASRPEPRR